MSSRTSVLGADSPRGKLLAAALGMVALLQLGAFYTLCADQVRRAYARDAQVQQQHAAVALCLQSAAESTIAGCYSQLRQSYNDGSSAVATSLPAAPGAALMRESGIFAMPAHFNLR